MIDASQAIQAILQGDWNNAITFNLQVLEQNPDDVETLNRLAFAYSALGKVNKARAMYQKVLEIDECNPIALKNLKKLNDGSSRKNGFATFAINNNMFLEEVGKTKVVTLVNTAPPSMLRTLQAGQPLTLCIKRNKIFVLDENEQFLGMLPDNISKRLIKFIKGGNKYITYIKAVENRNATIFMKEIKRASKFKNQPSFIVNDGSQSLVIHSKKKTVDTENQEGLEE